MEKHLQGQTVQINSIENMLCEQMEKLESVMENMTLSTVQQGKLQRAVKDRIRELLGSPRSKEYKEKSRLYFANLWNNLKESFNCGSRWQDLNSQYFDDAMEFVALWEFKES